MLARQERIIKWPNRDSVLAALFLLCSLTHQARQPLHFDHLGREEGLSQSAVNCMLRDRDGFMWFGTQDGLNLYDGKTFRSFQHQPGDSTSLSSNYIVSLCEDQEGKLWVGTMTGGLNRFDKHTGRFSVFLHSSGTNSISENTVWAVSCDQSGNIWAGTTRGLNKFEPSTGVFTSYMPDTTVAGSLPTEMVVSLFCDRQGRIWAGTVEGLCLFQPATGDFRIYLNPAEGELKGANIIWSVSEDHSGSILVGTDNGLYLLDPESAVFSRLLGSPQEEQLVVWSVSVSEKGEIWAGTHRGLFHLGPMKSPAAVFLHDPLDPRSLRNNNVWCIAQDPAGFIWAGTNDGICKSKAPAARFNLLAGDSLTPIHLSSSKVMAILEDRAGRLWVGTDGGGLNCIHPGGSGIRTYTSSNSGLRNDNVWALAEDQQGSIYIGNYQGGLNRWDPATDRIFAYPMAGGTPQSLSNKRVLALLIDRRGMVWIGTRGGGLSVLDPASGMFREYPGGQDDPSGFPSVTVLSLKEDGQGRIWAGTHEGGLALFDPENDHFMVFDNSLSPGEALSDNNVWAITFDPAGRMWLGTQGGIMVTENPGPGMKFRYLTVRDGLNSNFITGMQSDAKGDIWISSFNGLARLDISAFTTRQQNDLPGEDYLMSHPMITLFDEDHGLQGLEFNQGSSHLGPSGTMYFGGNNGLTYFIPHEIVLSSFHPPVFITALKIFNKDVQADPSFFENSDPSAKVHAEEGNYFLPENITHLEALSLTFRESVVSFEFASLDYSSPEKNRYAYRLDGFDRGWNYVGTQNLATYTNLDPGDYVFRVRATNADGVWSPHERLLKITIIPPFYKTVWFIVTMVFALLLAATLIIRRAFLVQKQKADRDKELIELQLRTIKSQIDPHFAFNAINSIASYIITEHPETAYDYFTRFARMIRTILEDNEKISVSLEEEIEFVRNYLDLQKMRFRDKFEYAIKVEDGADLAAQVPKMIIQSFAENAIKHGLMHRKTGGMLGIRIWQEGAALNVEVKDNGVGRKKAAELNPGSTHRGFRIVGHISELYRKLYRIEITQDVEDLYDEQGNAAGTRVSLQLNPCLEGERKFLTRIRKKIKKDESAG